MPRDKGFAQYFIKGLKKGEFETSWMKAVHMKTITHFIISTVHSGMSRPGVENRGALHLDRENYFITDIVWNYWAHATNKKYTNFVIIFNLSRDNVLLDCLYLGQSLPNFPCYIGLQVETPQNTFILA